LCNCECIKKITDLGSPYEGSGDVVVRLKVGRAGCRSGPNVIVLPRRHTTTAVLGECVVDEQVNDFKDRQHAGAKQQTDEAAHLTCTVSM